MPDLTLLLTIAAAAFNGILAGATLDQSFKQLPARQRMGALAYSAYSQAADLGNGIAWYAFLGIGAASLTLVAALVAFFAGVSFAHALPLYIAAVLSLLHSLVTTQAAPTLFSQRRYANDEAALAAVFDRFARWQTLRALFQLLAFIALLWALASGVRA